MQQGISVDKQSSGIMMVLSIYSPDDRYTATYIDNYTNLYVLDELKRVPGANRASVFGLPDIAMRVWLQPDRMAQLGITVQDVQPARSRARTRQFGIGQIGRPADGAGNAADVRGHRTGPAHQAGGVRGDHRARGEGRHGDRPHAATSGASSSTGRDYSISGKMNGRTATTIGVYQQPGANAVAVVEGRAQDAGGAEEAGFPTRPRLPASPLDTSRVHAEPRSRRSSTRSSRRWCWSCWSCSCSCSSLRATLIPILAVPDLDHRHVRRHAPRSASRSTC